MRRKVEGRGGVGRGDGEGGSWSRPEKGGEDSEDSNRAREHAQLALYAHSGHEKQSGWGPT